MGRDDGQDAAADVRGSRALELGTLVARDPQDVVHYGGGLAEDVRVKSLVDVTDAGTALNVGRDVGLVDVTDFAGLDVVKIAVDVKLSGDRVDLCGIVRRHRDFLDTG